VDLTESGVVWWSWGLAWGIFWSLWSLSRLEQDVEEGIVLELFDFLVFGTE
jgi:hypothetical protein